LFRKFWEKKCDIYFSEKNIKDSSKPEVKNWKRIIFMETPDDILNIPCYPSKKGGGEILVQ
jgi:hypothetical protein